MDGDPYGNRTRVSAVEERNTTKSIVCPNVHGAFAPLDNNDLSGRGDGIKEPPGANENPGEGGTSTGVVTKSEGLFGRKILTLNWGVTQ